MARKTRKNASKRILYRGWTLEVSSRGVGRWNVTAKRGGKVYDVVLFDGRVADAFQFGREWVDERKTVRGAARSLFSGQPTPRRSRYNPAALAPCHLLEIDDSVRLPDGREGTVEDLLKGQAYVRTTGGQLVGLRWDALVWLGPKKGERVKNPSVPALGKWKKEKDDCGNWLYTLDRPAGQFMIWLPTTDPSEGCSSKGGWKAAFVGEGGYAGFTSGDLGDAKAGVAWARRSHAEAISPNPAPDASALKRKLMGGGERQRNPARRERLDDLTGTHVSSTIAGATDTGQKIVRTRPAPGQPFQIVAAHSDTLDPSRDTYGLDKGYADFYRSEAAKKARADAKLRKGDPLERDASLELGRLGLPTTFSGVEEAFDTFMDAPGNLVFFENPKLDDLDAGDVTRDFMDRLEVGRGRKFTKEGQLAKRKHVKLSKTARGKKILELKGFQQVKAMLKYMFGLAGSRRRWKDVPWYMVNDYLESIADMMDAGPPAWYPLSSGIVEGKEFLARAGTELGPDKVRRLENHVNSQALWKMVGRLEKILKPPKGSLGKEGRKTLKCIPKEDRKLIRHRTRVLTEWAKHPALAPEWACVPDEKSPHMLLCTFPGIKNDVLAIEDACAEKYDATWPARQRAEYWDEGYTSEEDQYGSGVLPLEGTPSRLPAAAEDLDLPWETAANPSKSLKARLMR